MLFLGDWEGDGVLRRWDGDRKRDGALPRLTASDPPTPLCDGAAWPGIAGRLQGRRSGFPQEQRPSSLSQEPLDIRVSRGYAG